MPNTPTSSTAALLPQWTTTELRQELLKLTHGSSSVMVNHLLDGLEEDLPELNRRESLRELLAILLATVQSAPVSGLDGRPLSRGAPPMT